ncbi:MAG: DUF3575 domain-containing protein [Chitinophagaceae bacterium]|nr:DUF3575 domain-containing protein [Chitinophagaceae bacterium]
MRKLLLLAILICCLSSANAQERWGFSFTPAVVQSPRLHYGLQVGAEYRFSDRLSFLTEITKSVGNHSDSSTRNSSYFRIKPEVRYELPETRRGHRRYIGLQLSYTHRKWKDINGGCYFGDTVKDSSINFQTASISSPILTASIQYGKLMPITDNLFIDVFMGFGVRTVFTRYSDLVNISKTQYNRAVCKIVPVSDPAFWTDGTATRFHTNFGVRLLYRL